MLISCSVAMCVFSERCHVGLALFEYVEGVFSTLHRAFSASIYVYSSIYVYGSSWESSGTGC